MGSMVWSVNVGYHSTYMCYKYRGDTYLAH